jgi:hypothetical protein
LCLNQFETQAGKFAVTKNAVDESPLQQWAGRSGCGGSHRRPIMERCRELVDGKRAVEIEVNAAVAAPEFASQLDPLSPIADLLELRDKLAR